MSKPHSKTVRGTLDNPKTQEAIKSDKPVPDLGDHVSLKPANDDKPLPPYDSAPPPGQDEDKTFSDHGASAVSAPYETKGTSVGGDGGNTESKHDLPHSKQVRGTLANKDGKRVNPTQLGDPASLKAETSNTRLEQDVEREGMPKRSSKL